MCVCVYVCLYLSHTHAQTHTGRLLSISSTAHLQLSQQATKEDPDSVFLTWPHSWSERRGEERRRKELEKRRRGEGTCNKDQLAGMESVRTRSPLRAQGREGDCWSLLVCFPTLHKIHFNSLPKSLNCDSWTLSSFQPLLLDLDTD